MGLSTALATAMTGLRANQSALSIVSSNIANAQTPGYVARSSTQIETPTGDSGSNVRVTGVNRQLDQFIQAQLRTETSGGAYAGRIADVLTQLQSVYGTPGAAGSLENALSNFTSALQSLSSTPGAAAQVNALSAAQSLAQQLNATTKGIQALRSSAEQNIGTAAGTANTAMTQIAQINARLQGLNANDPEAATLLDQRDHAIDQLSQLMDVRVVIDPNNNQANVFTTTGVQLVGNGQASQLTFTSPGPLDASSSYNSNPAKSGVGSLILKYPNGATFDLVANNAIGSGQIAADLKLRDQTLVQAQTQVDQMAAMLASSLSDKTTAGAAVTSGAKAGFDLDLSAMQPGNSVNLTYTDSATNTVHHVTIVRVDDPSALPLTTPPNSNPNDRTIGVNFSGGMASVISQLNGALGASNLQFSNPAGSTLRALDDGTAAVTVNAATVTTTASTLTSGGAQLPLFTDRNQLYTGAITGSGSQLTGLAGRIAVNSALLGDPGKLQAYSASTAAGDTTRTDFLYSQLTTGSFSVSPQTGLGSNASPYKGTIGNYLQQFLSLQSNASTAATQLQQGQDVVVNTLQAKFNTTAGVSIDTEMANLIALQNSYAANAHVMSVVQQLMNTLFQSSN